MATGGNTIPGPELLFELNLSLSFNDGYNEVKFGVCDYDAVSQLLTSAIPSFRSQLSETCGTYFVSLGKVRFDEQNKWFYLPLVMRVSTVEALKQFTDAFANGSLIGRLQNWLAEIGVPRILQITPEFQHLVSYRIYLTDEHRDGIQKVLQHGLEPLTHGATKVTTGATVTPPQSTVGGQSKIENRLEHMTKEEMVAYILELHKATAADTASQTPSTVSVSGIQTATVTSSAVSVRGNQTATVTSSAVCVSGKQTATMTSSAVPISGNQTVTLTSSAVSVRGNQTATLPSSALPISDKQTATVTSSALPISGNQTVTLTSSAVSVSGNQTAKLTSSAVPLSENQNTNAGRQRGGSTTTALQDNGNSGDAKHSKNKKSGRAKEVQLVPVTFSLYIGEEIKVEKVSIVFEHVKITRDKVDMANILYGIRKCIWSVTVLLPIQHSKDSSYKYCVKLSRDWWDRLQMKSDKITEKDERTLHVRGGSTYQDYLQLPTYVEVPHQSIHNFRGKLAFIEERICGVSSASETREISMMLTGLFPRWTRINKEEFKEVKLWSQRAYDNMFYPETSLKRSIIFVCFAKLAKLSQTVTLDNFDKRVASGLLWILKEPSGCFISSNNDLRNDHIEEVKYILKDLLAVIDSGTCLLSRIKYFYPVFSARYIINTGSKEMLKYDRTLSYELRQTVLRLLDENYKDGRALISDIVNKVSKMQHLQFLFDDIKLHMSKENVDDAKVLCQNKAVQIVNERLQEVKFGDISALLEVHGQLSGYFPKGERYKEIFSRVLFDMMMGECVNWGCTQEIELLTPLVNDVCLSVQNRGRLVIHICNSRDPRTRALAMQLLKSNAYGRDISTEDLHTASLNWLMASDRAQNASPFDRIVQNYKEMGDLLDCPAVSRSPSVQTAISKRAMGLLSSVDITELLDNLHRLDDMGYTVRKVANEEILLHVKSILTGDNTAYTINWLDHLLHVARARSTSLFTTGLLTGISSLLLDHIVVEPYENKAKFFESIFQHSKTWTQITSSTGSLGHALHDHHNFKRLKQGAKRAAQDVKGKAMKYHHFIILMNAMLRYGDTESIGILEKLSCLKGLETAVLNAKKITGTVNERVSLLKDSLHLFLKPLSNFIKTEGLELFETSLQNIEEKLSGDQNEVTLLQAEDDKFWENVLSVAEKTKHLIEIGKSDIFRKLCEVQISSQTAMKAERSNTSSEDDDDSEDDDEEAYLGDLFGGIDEANTVESSQASDGERKRDSTESDEEEIGLKDLFSPLNEDALQSKEISITKLVELLNTRCLAAYNECFDPIFENRDQLLQTVSSIFEKTDVMKELDIASKYYRRDIPAEMKFALDKLQILTSMIERAASMNKLLGVFGVHRSQQADDFLDTLDALKRCHDKDDAMLFDIKNAMQKVERVSERFSDNTWSVIKELSRSRQLIDYLKEKLTQDFYSLIDAVEEHSEHSLKESDINNFIEVKRFTQPLLKADLTHVEHFFKVLQQSMNLGIERVGEKIQSCAYHLHSFKALVKGVGKREELTHEIIANAMNNGKYSFQLGDTGCTITLSYKRQKTKIVKTLDEINDLRSRALLLHGTYTKRSEVIGAVSGKNNDGHQLKHFATSVDHALMIYSLYSKLHHVGHFDYCKRSHNESVKDVKLLQEHERLLRNQLEEWLDTLRNAREGNFFLNFLSADRLTDVHEFFTSNGDLEVVLPIMQYINPTVSRNTLLDSKREAEKGGTFTKKLHDIGNALNDVFADMPMFTRRIHGIEKLPGFERTTKTKRTLEYTVQNDELFLAALDQSSRDVIAVVMELYANTTQCYPEPNQVLFCTEETPWEDLELMMSRCTHSVSPWLKQHLYCIANVELLTTDIQTMLIEKLLAIKEKCNLEKRIDSSSVKENSENCTTRSGMLLAVVCRGEDFHPIIEELSENSHRIYGMSEKAMKMCVMSLKPDISVVTSDLPGLGKTEKVFNIASSKDLSVKSLPIEGPVLKDDLVQRLSKLNIKPYHVLHLDISEVQSPELLNSFLFELLVLGTVSAGSKFFHLSTQHACIELSNTMNDVLLETIAMSKLFERVHISWSYEDLIVSEETFSSVQVVCQYLKAVDENTLDTKDIIFSGIDSLPVLSAAECQNLLTQYLPIEQLSFSILEIFLKVLADQLKRFSKSYYFSTSSLQDMVGKSSTVRSTLVKAMVKVFEDFSKRSVTACKSGQRSLASSDNELNSASAIAANRFQHMLQWTQENHLFFIFHGLDPHTVSPLYRELKQVPAEILDLFKNQVGQSLPDFSDKSRDELQEVLERVVLEKPRLDAKEYTEMMRTYALTPDNLLKMVLIYLRIKSKVPVVIMGETGCGKTKLVTYLAKTCGIDLEYFGFHAGTTQSDIESVISQKNDQAKTSPHEPFWVFLDEINTCDHMGLLNEIICHRQCMGQTLMPNICFIAACNPYKLRGDQNVKTAGLEGKIKTDELSKLVYRVHPLPESMTDYVWDYGSLNEMDEKYYIERMLSDVFDDKKKHALLVDLVFESQKFIRKFEGNEWCVSLRDVNRFSVIMKWMLWLMDKKQDFPTLFHPLEKKEQELRAMILTLAHCYHSRLASSRERRDYRKHVAKCFKKHEIELGEGGIARKLKEEQEHFVDNMELPSGTAKNSALLENVFVMIVCILNQIPVFVVGKPGCSKSLSMQLIRSNLRGQESCNEFYRMFPQVYVVSYQGSESSTSEGIAKVFTKARRYQTLNNENNVLAIVLLDEVGLAEVSLSNPLKVLHNLLEPQDASTPRVAVVGISNWALDGAKMNRAIHLSRPELDQRELLDTALAIREATGKHLVDTVARQQEKLYDALAKSYHKYQGAQQYKNFHGLRDYYSLVKFIAKSNPDRDDKMLNVIRNGLLRNFGGLSFEMKDIFTTFKKNMTHLRSPKDFEYDISRQQLVCDNISDHEARHLMLITSGDSALGILEHTLLQLGRRYELILGSRFEEDQSEDYNYRILSKIILCMERDVVLILKDLENVYSSLYDMLNQNYTIVDNKKNCRIALGPFSNPVCNVHDHFRCIVLVDQDKVPHTDPPFLNRFEKQLLRYSDVLTKDQETDIKKLSSWVDSLSTVPGFPFDVSSAFVGYNDDMLSSLVLQKTRTPDVLERCKAALLRISCPDAILRMSKCTLAQSSKLDVKQYQDGYFERQVHNGIGHFLRTVQEESNVPGESVFDEYGMKIVVLTHSSIFSNIKDEVQSTFSAQVEKLGSFKSEKEFVDRIEYFFNTDATMLILQCNAVTDGQKMPLAKAELSSKRSEFIHSGSPKSKTKHICIVVHIPRERSNQWGFMFFPGWYVTVLEPIEKTHYPLPLLLGKSVCEVLRSEIISVGDCIQQQLLHSFVCIDYTSTPRSVDELKQLIDKICLDDQMIQVLSEKILRWLEKQGYDQMYSYTYSADSWQVEVACNTNAIRSSSSISKTFLHYIKQKVQLGLAPLVYVIENGCAWDGFFDEHKYSMFARSLWENIFKDNAVVDIDSVKPPSGPECYELASKYIAAVCPFSGHFHSKFESVQSVFIEDMKIETSSTFSESDHELADMEQMFLKRSVAKFHNLFKKDLQIFLQHEQSDRLIGYFLDDICCFLAENSAPHLDRKARVESIKWAVYDRYNLEVLRDSALSITQLYVYFWYYRDVIEAQLNFLSYLYGTFEISPEEVLPEKATFSDDWETLLDSETTNAHIDSTVATKDPGSALNDNETLPDENFGEHTEPLLTDGNSVENVTKTHSETNGSPTAEDGFVASEDNESLDADSHRSDSSIDEDNDADDYTPEEKLIENVCFQLLPNVDDLKRIDVVRWRQKIGTLSALAYRVSAYPRSLHLINIFKDFVDVIMKSKDHNLPFMTEMYKCALSVKKDSEDPMESNVFAYFMASVATLPAVSDCEAQEFLGMFFSRCISANTDSPVLDTFLTLVKESKFPDLSLTHCGQVLRCITVAEAMEGEHIFQEVIGNSCLQEHFQLERIDEALLAMDDVSAPLAVLLTDTTENALKSITVEDVISINSLDSPLLQEATNAVKVLKCESGLCVQLVFAVAFLRQFLKSLVHVILMKHRNPSECDVPRLLTHVNSLFNHDLDNPLEEQRCNDMVIYVLKEIYHQTSMSVMLKFCDDFKDNIPLIRKQHFEDIQSLLPMGYNPMGYAMFMKEAMQALHSLTRGEDEDIEKFIEECKIDADRRFSLLAAILQEYFLPRYQGTLPEYKEQAASKLERLMGDFPELYTNVATCLLGRKDFLITEMKPSIQQPAQNKIITIAMIHLCSALASVGEAGNLFKTCCTDVHQLRHTLLPSCWSPSTICTNDVFYHNCKCGTRTLYQLPLDGQDLTCLGCDGYSRVQPTAEKPDDPQTEAHAVICSILLDEPPPMNVTMTLPLMSPVSIRVTRLVIGSSLLTGAATSTLLENDLQDYFSVDCEELLTTLMQQIKDIWEQLQMLLACTDKHVGDFLHACFERLCLVMDSCSKTCNTEEERDHMENVLRTYLDDIVVHRHDRVKHFKERISSCTESPLQIKVFELTEPAPYNDKVEDHDDSTSVEDNTEPRSCDEPKDGSSDESTSESYFSPDSETEKDVPKEEEKPIPTEGGDSGETSTGSLKEPTEEGSSESCQNHAVNAEYDSPEDQFTVDALFRLTNKPSIENLFCEYFSRCGNSEFLFLAIFFKHHKRLALLDCILPIVNWHRIVLARYGRKLKRKTATSQTIEQFLGSISKMDERAILEKAFDNLYKTCNKLKDDGKDVIPDTVMDIIPTLYKSDTFVKDCLITDKDGALYMILQWLVNSQNDFLDECLYAAGPKDCTNLSFMSRGTKAITKVIPIQDALQRHIVSFEWSKQILNLYQNNTKYGLGLDIQYEFRIIEADLVDSLVIGKAWLSIGRPGSLSMFHYAGELFHASSNILLDIKEEIPQCKELPKEVMMSIQRDQERTPENIAELLSQLEILMCILQHTGGSKDESLVEYASKWLSTSAASFPKHILPEPGDAIKLSHLVCLYQCLEEIQSSKSVESLSEKYRCRLERRVKERATQSMNKDISLLETLNACLCRFSYRYLSADTESTPRVEDSLVSFLNEPTIWPDGFLVGGQLPASSGCSEMTALLPPEVTVGHIYHFLTLLQTTIKEKREERDRGRVRKVALTGKRRKQLLMRTS